MTATIKTQEELYHLSRDGMFAAALQHFSQVYYAETEEEENLCRSILSMVLTALIPQTIQSEEDRWTVQFVYLASIRTNLHNIEVRMLNTMKDTVDKETYDTAVELSSIDASMPKGDDTYFQKITENLVGCAKAAGVVSIKQGFDDLDDLAFIVEAPGYDQAR